MLFNSLTFLYIFLPLTYAVFWKLRTKNQRYIWLTLTGYAFYSVWNYQFCALMALSTIVSYAAGLAFLKWTQPGRRKLILVLPIVFDLGLLGFFKYTNFFLKTWNQLGGAFDARQVTFIDIVLPIGISFYTFHTITYIVDCYRGVIVPTRNLFEFSCYVSLFSQLVSGPIVRFREIERDLENLDLVDRQQGLNVGWSFFVIGMAKKVLLADSIAAIIDPAWKNHSQLSTLDAWMCALGYSYQLYFDFSGYSDMAVGLGHLFGIRLPQNFNSPYRALDISDFWRRWHMSLSRVLRDYLYIPLGGNRGAPWFSYRNLIITMLLGGLWHGASWTFVVWGGYHGILLAAHKAIGRKLPDIPRQLSGALTFLAVTLGWVFFRSETFTMAASMFGKMFRFQDGSSLVGAPLLGVLLILAALLAHIGPNTFEFKHRWQPVPAMAFTGLFVASVAAIYGGHQSPFLYFQF